MPPYRPPHLYLDNTWYMVTAATHHHQPLLANAQAKHRLRDNLQRLTQQYELTLRAWVILGNHYHVLFKSRNSRDLPRFFAQLHGSTSRQINLDENLPARQIWQNYWDICIRTESDLWARFNYIHLNPVKHGYVQEPREWPFSSYQHYLQTKGVEWLADCLARHPVVEFIEHDAFEPIHPIPIK
jgi:putative transposase